MLPGNSLIISGVALMICSVVQSSGPWRAKDEFPEFWQDLQRLLVTPKEPIKRVPFSQSICWPQVLFPELCDYQALFKGLSTDLLSLLPMEALSRTLLRWGMVPPQLSLVDFPQHCPCPYTVLWTLTSVSSTPQSLLGFSSISPPLCLVWKLSGGSTLEQL